MNVTVEMSPNPMILVSQFNVAAKEIRSFREPMKEAIQKVLSPSFRENFDVGGRPSWEPLAEATLERKSKNGQGSSPLIATGKLRNVAAQFNIWTIDGGYLSENSSAEAKITGLPGAEYGGIHQEGTSNGKIPARPFLVVQEKDMDDMAEVFADYIERRVLRTALRAAF